LPFAAHEVSFRFRRFTHRRIWSSAREQGFRASMGGSGNIHQILEPPKQELGRLKNALIRADYLSKASILL